jgi:hypothetical protein
VDLTTDTSTPSTSPLRSMVRAWPLSLVLIVVGALLGGAYAADQPTTYTANARLAVGGSDIAAQAIPGFALASQEIASNYARFVSTGPTVQALPAGERADLVSASASPIPSSNVILLETKATSAAVALDAANQAATSLAKQVNDAVDVNDASKTLDSYTTVSGKVALAQQAHDVAQRAVNHLLSTLSAAEETTSTDLLAARQALVKATTALSALSIQQSALGNRYQTEINTTPSQSRLSVVQAAAAAGDDKTTRTERYGLLGLAGGSVLALLAGVGIERLRGRRRARRRQAPPPLPPAQVPPMTTDDFRTVSGAPLPRR